MSFFLDATPIWRREAGAPVGRATQSRQFLTPPEQSEQFHQLQAEQAARSKPSQPQSSVATPARSASNAAQRRSDWVEYDQAEQWLFDWLSPKDSEFSKTCAVEIAEHGKDASAAAVAEVVTPKALAEQFRRWSRLVLGDAFVFAKIEGKARERIDYLLSKPDPPSGGRKGPYSAQAQQKGRNTQAKGADRRAAQAQALRVQGWTAAEVAEQLGACVRTVRRWFRRSVRPELITESLQRVTSVQECSSTSLSFDRNVPEKGRQCAPNRASCSHPRPDPPDPRRNSAVVARLVALDAAQRLVDATRGQFRRCCDGWSLGDAALDVG